MGACISHQQTSARRGNGDVSTNTVIMETRYYFEPGAHLRVDGLLKAKGSRFYTHLQCVQYELESGSSRLIQGQTYAVPIFYFLMEPRSLSVKESLEDIYRQHNLPYMNHKFDKKRLQWIKNIIMRFMWITVVDNVIGPSNGNADKDRHWAVWKYDFENKDPEYVEPYEY